MTTWPKTGADDLPFWEKDPSAVKDYSEDWSAWLGTDTLSASYWTVQTGLTQNSAVMGSTGTTIWLSGGTHGQTYKVTNRVVTVGGRTELRSFNCVVRNQ